MGALTLILDGNEEEIVTKGALMGNTEIDTVAEAERDESNTDSFNIEVVDPELGPDDPRSTIVVIDNGSKVNGHCDENVGAD